MKILLLNSKIFILLLFAFCGNVKAECTITGVSVSANSLNCGTSPLSSCNGILYIGDGSYTSLKMDGNLDLTCLGPIQLIVNSNANIDFTIQNYDLLLAAGSSITFIGTGTLVPFSGNDCTSSDRIQVGGVAISNCKGTGGTMSFEQLTQGGYNPVSVTPSSASVCGSGSFTFTATATPSSGGTIKWYSSATGGILLQTGTLGSSSTYATATITATTTYYVEAVYSGYTTTPRKAVVAIVNPNLTPSVSISASANPFCSGTSVTFTATPTNGGATPVYQWKLNGGNVGTNSATYTNGTLANGNTVTCVMTSNASPCLTGSTVTSGTITMTVNPNTNIASVIGTTPLCIGGSATYSSNTVVLGGGIGAWSSSNTAVATVSAAGLVSGVTAGNCNIIYTITGGCGGTKSAQQSVTISPNLSASVSIVASPSGAICSGTSVTFAATPTNGGTTPVYQWKLNGVNVGVNAATYTNTVLANNDLVTCVITSNATPCLTGSLATSNAVTMTVNALPTNPSVTTTQPTCKTPTGTITVTTPSPAAGITYTITGTIPFVAAVTNTTGVFTGMVAGDYNVITTNGCASLPTPVVINSFVLVTNTWNGSAWSTNLPPTAEQKIIFAGDYPPAVEPAVDIVGCSCQVNALTDVIIKTGHKMTITNEVSVDGFLTFENDASLVQINNVTNFGEIDYIRTTDTGIYNTDYVYWSSPVEGITLGKVSNNLTLSDKYYSYEPTATGEDWKQESSLTPMVSGNGYIIRGPETSPQPGLKYTATFSGVPHNGHYEITPIFADKSYLLGNPYPSALDANTFLANNAAVLNGTLYFWTHNTDMQARELILSTAGSGAYAYTSNDYATYNATGGVGAAPDSGAVTSGAPVGSNPRGDNNANPPSGKIASGQGFFASSKTTSAGFVVGTPIVFDNDMRVGVIDITKEDNSQFFKTKNPNAKTAKTKVVEKNRIWLNLTNTQGAFKQTLIGYITDATNEYDDRFDGESFDGNEFVDFYSVNQEMNLVIQGRALPFDNTDEVPLGYRTTINGDFTINIDQTDGLLINQSVYLEDKLTKTVFDLKTGNYTFNTIAGTFNDRFVLHYKDNSTAKTLAATTFDSSENKILVSNKNKQIKINSFAETIDKVAIYDMLGRQIYQKENVDSNEFSIANLVSSRQTLVVKVMLQNGKMISKKIIF